MLQIPDFCCYKYLIFDEDYVICNKANNKIDWRIPEGSPTIHKRNKGVDGKVEIYAGRL